MTVKTGQKYQDADPRMNGRQGEVLAVGVTRAQLLWVSGWRTWVDIKRLESKAYTLVTP